jgi:2'-5' RNA ligase
VPESNVAALSPIATDVAECFRKRAQASSVPPRSPPERATREPTASAPPIVITLDKAEHWRKPELLCATATQPAPAAAALAQALKDALTAAGFAPDLKPFRVHATFARKVRRVTRALTMPPVAWTFTEFRLIESRTDPRGSSYTTAGKWLLVRAP